MRAAETRRMPKSRRRANRITRRVFIHRLAFFGGGVVLLGPACKRVTPEEKPQSKKSSAAPALPMTPSGTFTLDEFAVLTAACARLIPRDQDPGAVEAGVPIYIDRMLQTREMGRMKNLIVGGMVLLERKSRKQFGKRFIEASPDQQDELLTQLKNSSVDNEAQIFEVLMVLVLEGFLGDPSYGGNKDRMGWALVGFGTSEPPPSYDGSQHLHHHRGGG
jgi:gluconate 2-dehydrogenase gamma chain